MNISESIHCKKNNELSKVRELHRRGLEEINNKNCGTTFEKDLGIILDHWHSLLANLFHFAARITKAELVNPFCEPKAILFEKISPNRQMW